MCAANEPYRYVSGQLRFFFILELSTKTRQAMHAVRASLSIAKAIVSYRNRAGLDETG